VFVENQDKALRFYAEVLGFVKKQDKPAGDFKYLTVASPEGPDDIELLLEPNDNPVAQTFQQAVFEQQIPATLFFTEDVQNEYDRLTKLGVVFTTPPSTMESLVYAVFDDTCGNLIQIVQG